VNLFDELRGLLAELDRQQVDYALIGGLAVAVWGAPRATKDIDLLVQRASLPAGMAAARARGFTLEALPFEFKDGTEVRRVNKVDAAGDLLTVDFMLVNGNLETVWNSRLHLPFGDRHIVVASRDALIAMKAQAARPQDLMDIANLKDLDR
jgi:hypothetical protein